MLLVVFGYMQLVSERYMIYSGASRKMEDVIQIMHWYVELIRTKLYLICIKLASILHGDFGVTGTGMPFSCKQRQHDTSTESLQRTNGGHLRSKHTRWLLIFHDQLCYYDCKPEPESDSGTSDHVICSRCSCFFTTKYICMSGNSLSVSSVVQLYF